MIIRLKLVPTSIKIAARVFYVIWIALFVSAFVLMMANDFSIYAWMSLGAIIIITVGDLITFLKSGFSSILRVFFWLAKGSFRIRWNFFDGLPPFDNQQEDMAIAIEKSLNVEKNAERQTKTFIVFGGENTRKTTAVLQFLRSVLPTFTPAEMVSNKWVRDIVYMQCDHASRRDINKYFEFLKEKKNTKNRLFASALKNRLVIIDNAGELGEEFFAKYKNILKHSLGVGSFVLIFNEDKIDGIRASLAGENKFEFYRGIV